MYANTVENFAKHAFMRSRKGRRPMRVAKIVEKESAGTGWSTKNKHIKRAAAYIPELQRRYGDAAADVFLLVEDIVKEASEVPGIVLDAIEWDNVDNFVSLCKEASVDPVAMIKMSERYYVNPWASLDTLLLHEKVAATFPGKNMLGKAWGGIKNVFKKSPIATEGTEAVSKAMTPGRRKALLAERAKLQERISANAKPPKYVGKQHSQMGASPTVRAQNVDNALKAQQQQLKSQQAVYARYHPGSRVANRQAGRIEQTQRRIQSTQASQQRATANLGQAQHQPSGFGTFDAKAGALPGGSVAPKAPNAVKAPSTPQAPAKAPQAPTPPAGDRTLWQKAKPWVVGGGVTAGLGYGGYKMLQNGQRGYSSPMSYKPQGY